jgi:hypothetical protein
VWEGNASGRVDYSAGSFLLMENSKFVEALTTRRLLASGSCNTAVASQLV